MLDVALLAVGVSAKRPEPKTMVDRVTGTLARRLRFAFIACVASIVVFALADLRLAPDHVGELWALKLAQLLVLISAFGGARKLRDRGVLIAIGLLSATALYALTSLSAVLANEAHTMPLVSVAIAIGAATLLPWGVWPQVALVAIASAAIGFTVRTCTGSLAPILSYPNIGVAAGMVISVYLARELERSRGILRLLTRAAALGPVGSPSSSEEASEWGQRRECVFRNDGEYWTIAFEGRTIRMKDSQGLQYVADLLRHPGRDFHVLDLAVHGSAQPGPPPEWSSGQPALEPRAKAMYQRRLDELQEKLEQAYRDEERASGAAARREIESIIEEVAAALRLGRADLPPDTASERARSIVTKQIDDAIAMIRVKHPALGHHLATTIKTGFRCTYTPGAERPISWQ